MRILLFGATGMVGQGVLRECILDDDVEQVVVVGRHSIGKQHRKIREIVQADVTKLADLEADLATIDACFFCLGVSSAGMSEAEYTRLTYDLTLAIAKTLVRCNPNMRFIYVSGLGTDSSAKGRVMWARVKGKTENALLQLRFRNAYMFRPGVIIPFYGAKSRTRWTRFFYAVTKPLHGLMRVAFPGHVTTTEQVGRAMIAAAKHGHPKPILETSDINLVQA